MAITDICLPWASPDSDLSIDCFCRQMPNAATASSNDADPHNIRMNHVCSKMEPLLVLLGMGDAGSDGGRGGGFGDGGGVPGGEGIEGGAGDSGGSGNVAGGGG
ncbi:hypothetical protein CYMTET_40958 [Cymbomonas tetramitiformis]|uniref:Uncharacterized protein n=1 Tax=Cymbomonas tetramitiformis TaxID=36881 RepID=A0AAE0C926_9CHLO|nr:hypothetical protein CYMTET_40958 [Cymbomonas tetramitiformis]